MKNYEKPRKGKGWSRDELKSRLRVGKVLALPHYSYVFLSMIDEKSGIFIYDR